MIVKKYNRITQTTAAYGILVIVLLWTIFSVYWMIKSSLTVDEEMYVTKPSLSSNVITSDHYIDLVYNISFMHNVWNSFVITIITTIIHLATGILKPYAMTRLKYPGRSFFRNSIMILYLMPTAVLFVPMYMFVSSLGFYDSKYSLLVIYPASVISYCCYMLINYFKAIPYALEETVLIDDCNRLQTLWYIVMSIAFPEIAVVVTFAFIMTWNEYLYATIMTTSNVQKTTTVVISSLKCTDSAIRGRIVNTSVICSLSVTLLYIVVQSMLIPGKYEGSVK